MKRFLLIVFILVVSIFQLPAQGRGTSNFGASPIMRFYPNPASSFVSFDFQKSYDRGYALQIYNFLGKKMYEAANIGQKTTINLNDFNRGIYIYQLYDRTGKLVESGKFQVSR